jgi:heme-degrading monooxygenase HmoA
MFIAIVRFPPIKKDQDKEFRKWFNWSNLLLKNSDGFISRRLMLGRDGRYAAIVEHSGYDTFKAMHASSEHKLVHDKALSLFEITPKPEFFKVIIA